MNKLNKQKMNTTQYTKELQLVNEYAQAQTPIFKAILTTLDGDKTFYFKSLKALNDFAKREKNFGLTISKLTTTNQKINLNLTILRLSLKLAENKANCQKLKDARTEYRRQKREVKASKKISEDLKRTMIRDIEENLHQAKKDYDNFYNNYIRRFEKMFEYVRDVASKWMLIKEIPLNTAILRKYN